MPGKKTPLTSAETTARSVQKKKDAGMIQIKVWVRDPKLEPEAVTTEADKVRAYAKKLPLTKKCLKNC